MLQASLGKYRAIVVAIALFLILDLGLLILDQVITRQVREDAAYASLANRQRLLALLIDKTAQALSARQVPTRVLTENIAELAEAATEFDRTLRAFSQGGVVRDSRGEEVAIAAIGLPDAQPLLLEANALWLPLADTIHTVTRSATGQAKVAQGQAEVAQELALRLLETNPDLLRLMSRLAVVLDNAAGQKTELLRMAKLGGILLAALNFFLIVFHFIAHLNRNDQALEQARKETGDILRTTREGLFLLDSRYIIGSQHSRVLESIIGHAQFVGVDFFTLLRPMVSEKTLNTAREYLDLLFKHDVKEKLVVDLNPLNCVQILYGQGTPQQGTRYLEFGFNRVREAGKITHLLVTVNNITQRIELERSLKDTEARTQRQMSMLIEIMRIEPADLSQFLHMARAALEQMNSLLQQQETGLSARGSKVHALFRQTHRVKGDAAALGMTNMAATFEHLEDTLTGMHEQHHLAGEDFLPVAVQVKALYEQIEAIESVMAQIAQVRGMITVEPPRAPGNPGVGDSPFVQRWRDFALELAKRHGNAVTLAYNGIDIGTLPTNWREAVNSLVNQFIRNAVVHGIEPPAERRQRGKPEAGQLAIQVTQRDDGGIDLSFRDDGRGVSVGELREAAIRRGRLTAEEASAWEPRRIIGLIFEPGISTRQDVDGDAGRGIGLDTVREIVSRLGGHLRIGTTAHEYCHFRISFATRPRAETRASA